VNECALKPAMRSQDCRSLEVRRSVILAPIIFATAALPAAMLLDVRLSFVVLAIVLGWTQLVGL
jgi:hypothetical protein